MKSQTAAKLLATPIAIIALGILWSDRGYGQIVPDNSLGAESSVVLEGIESQLLEGGAVRGANLFHSFREFNVNSGAAAYFANPGGIENILSRVTGGNISKIFGTLGVLGNANLFFINPAGIVFGPDARLDLGGDFVGTTADSILFGNGFEFSATNPQAPPLLTINIPRGLNLRQSQGKISVEGTGNPDIFPTEVSAGLAVAPGKTLALVGSDVTLTDAIVTAPSGRIEIGSVLDGQVSFTQALEGIELGYSQVESFGEIKLLETSSVFNPNIIPNPSAGIFLHGGKVRLDGRSQLASVTVADSPGSNIVINGAESVEIGGVDENTFPYSSWVVNQVAPQATGSGGDITVTTPELSIRDGGRIQTISLGAGPGGNVEVNADNIIVKGFSPRSQVEGFGAEQNFNSRIASENNGTRAGGNISISTGQIELTDGGQVLSLAGPNTTAAGGEIIVNGDESITAIGAEPFNSTNSSGIISENFGAGSAGNIMVSISRLMLDEGAYIGSSVLGTGSGADVIVKASESIFARGVNQIEPAVISGIYTVTLGAGDAGSVSISTEQLTLLDGGSVLSTTLISLLELSIPGAGTGNAGNIEIVASEVELIGAPARAPENVSSVISFTSGSGNAGDVSVSTGRLTIEAGASLSSGVLLSISVLGEPLPGSGRGKGGNIRVKATESIEVIGIGGVGASNLGTLTLGEGDAGDTIISTQRLTIANGGDINSTTASSGNAGRLTINATEQMVVRGIGANGDPTEVSANARFFSEGEQQAFFLPSLPSGKTGELTINTPRLIVENGGSISVEHVGDGDAGSMQLLTDEIFLSNGGSITASTASGQGGNVILNVGDSLQLRNDSAITVEAVRTGNGGNLTINSDTIALLSGSKITANAVGGDGGNINITARGLFSSNDSAITASSRFGVDGVVEVDTPDTDPTRGLIELSNNVVDAASLIGKDFCAISRESSFIVTGRGGLPPNPNQDIITNTALASWIEPVQPTEGRSRSHSPDRKNSEQISSASIVPARGWIFQPDGSVRLVGYDPTGTSASGRFPRAQRCGSSESLSR